MELCSKTMLPYDECHGNHEGECVWLCGDCHGNVYNCTCDTRIPEWAIDPRRNGAAQLERAADKAVCSCKFPELANVIGDPVCKICNHPLYR